MLSYYNNWFFSVFGVYDVSLQQEEKEADHRRGLTQGDGGVGSFLLANEQAPPSHLG